MRFLLTAAVCATCLNMVAARVTELEQHTQAAIKAEARQEWDAALSHYENIYESLPTDDATRSQLRLKFAELRPKVAPNTDLAKAGVWRVRAYAFRELDFSWKEKSGKEHRAQFKYREDELERLRRGMEAFAERIWAYTYGQLRIAWTLEIIDKPLKEMEGDDSFWPGPGACMPYLTGLKAGEVDTIMVFVKAFGDPAKGDAAGEVPQMLLGGALGSLGDLTRGATYIGFNWGTGTAANEPDGEPMVHEWLHSAQWTIDDYQGYPRGLMATSDGGKMEGEEGGDPCFRRRKDETTWMRFYQHIMRDHATRKMWREISVTQPATNVWLNAFCRSFAVLGPFSAVGKSNWGLDEPFINERLRELSAPEQGKRMWRMLQATGQMVDLGDTFGTRAGQVCYLAVDVQCRKRQKAQVRLGSDDGCKLWHNGRLLLTTAEPRGAEPDQNIVGTTLVPGRNLFLLKVANVGGGWGAILRVADEQGLPLRDAEFKLPEVRTADVPLARKSE